MDKEKEKQKEKVVVVVGAGWAGLYAIRWLKEEGFTVIAFERAEDLGGIWRKIIQINPECEASSSKTYLHASSMEFQSHEDFPSAGEIVHHLETYASKHELISCIRFGHRVESFSFNAEDEKWIVTATAATSSGAAREGREEPSQMTVQADYLVLARGLCGVPKLPAALHEEFSERCGVECMHSFSYMKTKALPTVWTEPCGDASVLVVGGGESATDVASELITRGVRRVVLSLRKGRWFLPRMKLPSGHVPGDAASRRTFFFMRFSWFQRLLDCYVEQFIGIGGHGQRAWMPSKSISSWSCFLNKRTEDVKRLVREGHIQAAGRIMNIVPDEQRGYALVTCENVEKPIRVCGVVFATGFKACNEEGGVLDPPSRSFLHVFPTTTPGCYGRVAHVGAVRPNVGSIPSLAEVGAIFASRVFSGRCRLPSIAVAQSHIRYEEKLRMASFPEDGAQITTLVHSTIWLDKVLSYLGFWIPLLGLPPLNLLSMYGLREGINAWQTLFNSVWSPLELDVLLNPDTSGRATLERIRFMHHQRREKMMSSPMFLTQLLSFALQCLRSYFLL